MADPQVLMQMFCCSVGRKGAKFDIITEIDAEDTYQTALATE